jgi:DNA invertase Pin-like site-specific DNA recombinase
MNERAKITASHHSRQAIVYLRQSSSAQVEHNRESTERQYALATKARELGWPDERIVVIDEDLGLSGSGSVARSGFARLTAEVALARVGLVLGLEVSRLARNNADWHRLIDLAGLTDTRIGDADGIYHPALFNDRLLLGLKGTMSEAELHVLRARLNGGIRNKAARGELRRGLPIGLVWGEADGEVLFHPDEAVITAIRSIFERFAETGSVRRVWLWLREQGHKLDERACRDPLGRRQLSRYPPGSDQPRLCWSLRLWQDSNRDDARCLRRSAEADQTSAPRSLAGVDQRASPRIHRLADL